MRWPLSAELADALWRRVPLPYRSYTSVSDFGDIRLVRMARTYFGRELLPVYCFAIGDTLVDTGHLQHGALHPARATAP